MTSSRAILGTAAAFVLLIVATAWGSMVAALMGNLRLAESMHHASWMFVLAGGMCAAAGLVIALVFGLLHDVRTDRCVSPRVSRGLYRPVSPTTIVARRHSSPRSKGVF